MIRSPIRNPNGKAAGSDELGGPWRITFDTNPDDCNLHCIMCEEHSRFSISQSKRILQKKPLRRMDFNIIENVTNEAVQLGNLREIIPSTMGEPLLYREFERIIELCKETGVKLNLTTNGTFPRLGAEEWARMIVPVASDVKISWNGATDETAEQIMRGAKFENVLQNVRDFIRIRDEFHFEIGIHCRITFQLTIIELNYREIPDIVKLAAELGVNRIKGHHLWIHAPEMECQSMRRSEESIIRWNEVVRETRLASDKHRLPSGQKIQLENVFPIDPKSESLLEDSICPFLEKEALINFQGRFDPCCAPDYLRKDLGFFGSVLERSFSDIWFSKEYRELCKSYNRFNVCQKCNMRSFSKEAGH